MLVEDVTTVKERDVEAFAWRGLERFTNKERNVSSIMSLHNIPSKHKKNVGKQAEQIRYAILLARDYYKSSLTSTLATKPVLLYYSCMSLALAEILLKSDGNSSLDKARGEHRHHGLVFSTDLRNDTALSVSAQKLRAKPMIKDGEYSGTFELWRRVARHLPVVGKISFEQKENIRSHRTDVILHNKDVALEKLDSAGFGLLDCFKRIPAMADILESESITIPFVRGNITESGSSEHPHKQNISLAIHPAPQEILDLFINKFVFDANFVNHLNLREAHSGFILDVSFSEQTGEDYRDFPNGININEEEVYFFAQSVRLNEFGNIYVSLFILSNLARYYPDVWIYHIENSTSLSLAISHFLNIAQRRMALLSYSELSRSYFIE